MSFFPKRWKIFLFNFYPPFVGAGIRIKEISPDMTRFVTEMELTPMNVNYVGVHFGGSLYAMADPFFMLILLENLGEEFIVWDKAAKIQFVKPGKGKVTAEFQIDRQTIEDIREEIVKVKKKDYIFQAFVKDEKGEVVAEIEKTIYVRKKGRLKQQES